MQTILVVFHVFLAIGIVGLVLMQHGKGADAGAAFGSGASATVFGARGSASFLSRATAVLAALFFATSMALAYYASQAGKQQSLVEDAVPEAAPKAPAAIPAPAPVTPSQAPQAASDLPPIAVSAEGTSPEAQGPEVQGKVQASTGEVGEKPADKR